jgi:hypothetical protein
MTSYLKELTVRMPKLTKAAQGETCVACGCHSDTVVLAHRNEGKGGAIKSHDCWGLDLCINCHTTYDTGKTMTRDEKRAWFNEHYPAQVLRWIRKGVLK